MKLEEFLERQINFSSNAFGKGKRTKGIIDHITKELKEIEDQPDDLEEWVDVIILAMDGAWRAGHSPWEISVMLQSKLIKNMNRRWPDHRGLTEDHAIEHLKYE